MTMIPVNQRHKQPGEVDIQPSVLNPSIQEHLPVLGIGFPCDPSLSLRVRSYAINTPIAMFLEFTIRKWERGHYVYSTAAQKSFTLSAFQQDNFFPLTEGELVSFNIFPQTAVTTSGANTYLEVSVGIGNAVASYTRIAILAADWLSDTAPFTWNENVNVGINRFPKFGMGQGALTYISQANPGAGADWTFTVPANVLIQVKSVMAKLTTAVAVANRIPHLRFTDGGGFMYSINTIPDVIPASLAMTINWGENQYDMFVAADLYMDAALTTVYSQAGHTISTVTTAIQAADQWGSIRLFYEAFVLPNTLVP